MSTSIPTSNAPSSASPSSRPPTIHLPLVPNQSAGPFVLGSSLHRTLAYLRSSNPSSTSARSGVPPNLLFPSVEIAYDDDEQQDGGDAAIGGASKAAQQPWSGSPSSSSMTGLSPIRVRPCPGVDLIFSTPQGNGGGGDSSSLPAASPVGPPRLQCIIVALGGSHDSEEGAPEDEVDPYHEEQYRRPILVTYKGQRLEEIRGCGGGGASGSGRLTRGFIQQVFGPTYPAKRYKQGDGLHAAATSSAVDKKIASSGSKSTASSAASGASTTSSSLRNKWLIQYPGLAFLFDDAAAHEKGGSSKSSSGAAGDVSKDARPTHLVLHHGDDALHPTELAWPIVSGPVSGSDEATTSSSKDSPLPLFNTAFTPTAAHVSDSEPVPSGTLILHSARLLPGRGVDLFLLCAPFPATAAIPQLATVALRLGETRQQDALLALGPAERRWIKEAGERDGTAEARLPRGDAGGREGGDGEAADEEEGIGSTGPRAAAQSSSATGGSRAEFWSYPSLGFDLLFYHSSTGTNHRPLRRAPIDNLADDLSDFDDDFDASAGEDGSRGGILGKIVVHSDVPGSALWGRYECVPWYIEGEVEDEIDDRREVAVKTAVVKGTTSKGKSGRATSSTNDEKSRPSSGSGSGSGSGSSSSDERRRPLPKVTASSDQTRRTQGQPRRIDRTTPPSQLRSPAFSFLHRNQTHTHTTTTTPLETMHLDRSADEHEFHPSRGTLRLDVRTSLEGFPGAVAEVLLKRRGEGQGQEGEDVPAVVVGWTIVEG